MRQYGAVHIALGPEHALAQPYRLARQPDLTELPPTIQRRGLGGRGQEPVPPRRIMFASLGT